MDGRRYIGSAALLSLRLLGVGTLVLTFLLLLLSACVVPPVITPTPARVAVRVDGERRTLETRAETVGTLLELVGVELGDLDRVRPPETARIEDGMLITVTRIWQTQEVITETLPFKRETVRNASLPEGETRLLQAGREGVRQRVYRLTFEDGVEVDRILVKDEVSRPPQDEVLLVGTRPRVTTVSITGTLAYLESQDAWVMRGSTANPRRLTFFGDLDGRVFALSPEGRRLLFTRPVTESGHFNALWLVPTTGAEIEPVETGIRDVLWADWAPDGERIAWTTAEVSDQPPGWRGRNDLWRGAVTRGHTVLYERQVLEAEAAGGYGWWGTRYRWAPDGDRLAYARPESVGVVDLETGTRRPLARFPAYRTYSSWAWTPDVAWSAEGTLLYSVVHGPPPMAVNPEESPVFDLWALEATGAYSAEVASEVGMWTAPVFSPDGETLLFGRARIPYQSHLSSYELCTMDRDGSNQRCFFPPKDESGVTIPRWWWSPDQAFVALILRSDLHVLRLEDNVAIPVTDSGDVTTFDWQ
ncbi:MAG: G5 domain-containing protein [Anaerolineae bacterium]